MVETTDLKECKRIAKNFLHLDIEIPNEKLHSIISHPFIENTYVYDEKSESLVNILENREAYKNIINKFEKAIDSTKDYMGLYYLLRKQYRITYLKYAKEHLSVEDFSNFLINSWIDDEYANQNINVSKVELLDYFKVADKKNIMDEKELEILSNLEDEVTIYRGVTEYNKKDIKVLSWTLDKEKALWFATRFKQKGFVYSAKIKKEDILAFCDKRNEKEVIIDYNKIYDLELISRG